MDIKATPTGVYAKQHAIIIQENETIGYSLNHMIKFHLRHIPIINAEFKLVGVLTANDILKCLIDSGKVDFLGRKNSEVMSNNVYSANSNDRLIDTILTMNHGDLSAIPVLSDSRNIDGIITAKDIILLDLLWNQVHDGTIDGRRGIGIRVNINEAIDENFTLWEAIEKLFEIHSRQILVKNTTTGEFTGIVSQEKILASLVPLLMFGRANISFLKQRKVDSIVREPILNRNSPILVKPLRMWMNNQGVETVMLFENGIPVKIINEKHLVAHLVDYL